MVEKGRYSSQIDHDIVRLAARQHGNVSRTQLLDLGLTPAAIKNRIQAGQLHPFPSGVYGVGRPARTDLEKAAAVALAGGPHALLSHASALALWDLAAWPNILEITAPTKRNPRGVTAHRCFTLTPKDRRHRRGIPVTSPARTLLDCAPRLTDGRLTRLVNDALRAGRVTRAELREQLERCGNHRGAGRLRPHAAPDAPAGATASPLEDDFVAFCTEHGLPAPLINHGLPDGREVDAYFPAERLIVEIDSWEFHRDRETFERDRAKDAAALARGQVTIRTTWRRLHTVAAREAAQLHAICAARRDELTRRAA